LNAHRGAVFNFPSSLVIITLEHNNIYYSYSRDHTSRRHVRLVSYTRILYPYMNQNNIFINASASNEFWTTVSANTFAVSPHYTFTRVVSSHTSSSSSSSSSYCCSLLHIFYASTIFILVFRKKKRIRAYL